MPDPPILTPLSRGDSRYLAGVPVAIVDANNINVEVLGTSAGFPVDRKVVREVLLDNPLGQNDELTPIIVVRRTA